MSEERDEFRHAEAPTLLHPMPSLLGERKATPWVGRKVAAGCAELASIARGYGFVTACHGLGEAQHEAAEVFRLQLESRGFKPITRLCFHTVELTPRYCCRRRLFNIGQCVGVSLVARIVHVF